jgi:transcriptional regulator with XRE-family HTH domain
MGRTTPPLPLPVRRALRKLGADIRDARRRRRIPAKLLAERVMTSHVTLAKVERGDPSVSMGVYATALFVLGLADRLGDVADPRADEVGLALDEARLPQRVRRRSRKSEPGPETEP